MTEQKPLHTIVLDTGPIIKGDPSISSLRAQSEQLVTLPSVIQEIKDEATRTRVQTTLLPFLVLRSPKESSVKVISDFAQRTGDLSVLSRVDVHLLALAYDLECERNGGDWRLRKTPGEKRINGPSPSAKPAPESAAEPAEQDASVQASRQMNVQQGAQETSAENTVTDQAVARSEDPQTLEDSGKDGSPSVAIPATASEDAASDPSTDHRSAQAVSSSEQDDVSATVQALQLSDASQDDNTSDSDSEGWITPSNLKKKREEDSTGNTNATLEPKVLQVVRLISLTFRATEANTTSRHSSHLITQCKM